MKNTRTLPDIVDHYAEPFVALADTIWAMPEICYTEHRSAAEHEAMARAGGFRVTTGLAGIPTALMAEAGEGGPVIAILGEYDALPGLSQEAGVAQYRPVEAGGHGHGCGHNLLGSAALLAATAVKQWLEEQGLPGRVRYYGCPAEEGGAAKTFMVRAGAFDDVDIALCWHPHCFTEVTPPHSLANTRMDFSFTGRASHAAAFPHLGRSALDAVELMSVGVNYMREHMPSDARIHYAVLDTGGVAPNVVQAHARVRYSIRATDLPGMVELVERVKKVAEGAALMTETRVEASIVSAVSNLLGNTPLETAMNDVLTKLGGVSFDDEDRAFAAAIRKSLSDNDIASAFKGVGLERNDDVLFEGVVPQASPRQLMMGSTDVGDVSWAVPTVQAHAALFAIGTPFHSWQLVAQGKSPAAHKGMVFVAKAMAMVAERALSEPALITAAKQDLDRRRGGHAYQCPMPPDVAPPLTMSLK
ncbi:amidohydrolase [Allorhizobium undicola]|uniref:amidohydrolase n=1 Tax=Allorhizobium undicola TaxID=78527 RepID=UPI003D35624B